MLETSARLLRLLSLLEARPDWSGPELAERLEVTARTVRRDVERLRELGYPVHATPGVAGGYRLGAGAALPPLLLGDDEAVAVAIGLRTAAAGTVAGIEESSVRALTKLERILPTRLRHQVTALGSVTVSLADTGPTVDATTLTIIAAACRDRVRLRFDYRRPDGSGGGERTVEPLRLACTARRWYLLAWDLDREDWRTFRVDRIATRPAAGHRFTPREPPGGDVTAYLHRAIFNTPYPHQARVTFHASAEAVAQRVPPTFGWLEAVDEHRCVAHVGGARLDIMPVYLANVGFEFEVHEPPELVEQVRALAGLFSRAADR